MRNLNFFIMYLFFKKCLYYIGILFVYLCLENIFVDDKKYYYY